MSLHGRFQPILTRLVGHYRLEPSGAPTYTTIAISSLPHLPLQVNSIPLVLKMGMKYLAGQVAPSGRIEIEIEIEIQI